mmetsp:Transcript_118548/g.236110  ORF Transcript_118548/g.236110 Transcript_118548/m.236110 type:complete len:554 (-) Transcript_118548:39-1700(-)
MTVLGVDPALHGVDASRLSSRRGGGTAFSGSSVTRKHRSRKQQTRDSHSAPPSDDHQRSAVVYRATLEALVGECKYYIHVMHRSGLRWKVCRKISEFEPFHGELATLLDTEDSYLLPQIEHQVCWMPNFVKGLLAESCDQGLQSMQAYLDDVLRIPRIAQLKPVLKLLGVQKPEPPAGLRLAPRSWGHELEVRPSRACSTSEEGHQGPVDGYKIEIKHLETGTCFPITREVGWSGLLVQKAQVGQLVAGNYRFTVCAFNSAGESGTVSIIVKTSTNQSQRDAMPPRGSTRDGGPVGTVPVATLPAYGTGAAIYPLASRTDRRRRAYNCIHMDSQRPGASIHAAAGSPASMGTMLGGSVQTTTSELLPLSLVQAFASGLLQGSANQPSRDHALISAQALPAETPHLSALREPTGDHMQGGVASPQLHERTVQRLMSPPRRYLRAQPNGGPSSFTCNLGAVPLIQQQSPDQSGSKVTQQEREWCAESATTADASHHVAASEQLCVVCLMAPKTHAFVPCGHRCVCASCGSNLCKETRASCPVCRAPAQQLLHVFV